MFDCLYIALFLSNPFALSTCLSICLSRSPCACLFLSMLVYVSVCVQPVYLSNYVCLSVCQSVCLHIFLSVCISVLLSVSRILFIYPFVCLFVYCYKSDVTFIHISIDYSDYLYPRLPTVTSHLSPLFMLITT